MKIKLKINKEDFKRKLAIKDSVERIIERTEVVREQPIVKEVALSETPEQVGDKLNTLKEYVEQSVIKGLEKKIASLEEMIEKASKKGGGFKANNATKFYPLTADGVTKIFTVPKSVASIVLLSDFPYILFEGSGFSINATRTQITLTTVVAPSAGAQLLYQYSSYFNI